jgi:hypothetical protein
MTDAERSANASVTPPLYWQWSLKLPSNSTELVSGIIIVNRRCGNCGKVIAEPNQHYLQGAGDG